MRSSELAAMREKLSTRSAAGTHEEMSPSKWRQTAKDVPVAVGSSALGWGIGKTLGDLVLQNYPELGEKARRHSGAAGAVLGGVGSYAYGVRRGILRERREQAEKQKKSSVPQQSRRNPRPRRKDPWRYDDRDPFFLGLM